jgi:hypothetical protein
MRLSLFMRHVGTMSVILLVTARCAFADKKTESDASGGGPASQAALLVRKALEAEAAGATQERSDYLRQSLVADPHYAPAHWQLGEVRVGDAWLPVDAAASENSWSGKFAAYRQLRDAAAQTANDQMRLARWCEGAGLKDQERLHLAAALQLRPTNVQQRDIMTKLGLPATRNS